MLEIFDKNLALEQDGDLINMMNRVRRGLEQYIPGDRIMTDDNAPVELPGMKVMDELIMSELEYYRGIYKQGGIAAPINAL